MLLVRFNPAVLRIVRLALVSLLCCHWFGCIWWFVSDIEMSHNYGLPDPWEPGENNWVASRYLRHTPNFGIKYAAAFFWGAGFVTSMVPRDIEPVTPLEYYVTVCTTLCARTVHDRLRSASVTLRAPSTLTVHGLPRPSQVFMMFCGLLLGAVAISSFASAIFSMDSKQNLVGHQLDTIRNYLILKNVAPDLRSRILEYCEYKMTSTRSLSDVVRAICSWLPLDCLMIA